MSKKTVVLGVGNLLMGDEGAGIHITHYLENNFNFPETDIVDGGTGGFHLLEYFQNYERVILVDATLDGRMPGTIDMLTPKYSRDYPPTLTAHDIGLKDLLDSLYLMEKQPQIILFTISIGELSEVNLELSPEIQSSIPLAAQTIADYLQTAT